MNAIRSLVGIAFVGVSLTSVWACSSSSNGASTGDGGADAAGEAAAADGGAGADALDNGEASTTYPAFRPDVPQLVITDGGVVNASPRVRPVYFSGETFASPVDDTLAQWFASGAWTEQTSQYGIGPASLLTPASLTEAAATALTDADIATWLAGKLDGSHAEFGAVDATTLANEIFVLFYPSTTIISAFGSTSCTGFGGYYYELAVGSSTVSYVVVGRCPMDGADAMVTVASNLIVASVGNPHPVSNPGYSSFDLSHRPWGALGGPDLAQPCTQLAPIPVAVSDGGLPIVRTWSNSSMAAYHHPCVPLLDATPFFVSVPVMTDDVATQRGPAKTKGIIVPVGQSRTVDVLLLSDGPTSGPWTVRAEVFPGQSAATDVDFALDRTTGQNGEKLHLTVTPHVTGAKLFLVTSTLGSKKTYWVGRVN